MPIYMWKGKTVKGEIKNGEVEAGNSAIATAMLRRQQIIPLKIKEKGKEINIKIPGLSRDKVDEKEVVVFTRQFATMIDAGLPLVQCLDILSSQQKNKAFKKALSEVKASVEGGLTFADSLKKHPNVFNHLYVNLVAAGEAGGILDTILNRLAAFMEKVIKLKSKVRSALVYPATIVSVAVLVIGIMLIYVIPTFEGLFKDFGEALPAPTQIVINISRWFKNNVLYVLIATVVLIVGLWRVYKTEKGRRAIDRTLLNLPIFGDLLRKVSIARFTRTLGTMVSSGVPILESLDIVARTAGNVIVEEAIMKTKKAITEGKTIAEPLSETGVFPPMVTQMISVGEATGAMDTMLSKIADFYDDEVDTSVNNLTSLIEPILMIFLGVIIGGIVITMYLPVFKLAGAF